MSRSDPIRVNYYNALERAENIANGLFYFGAVISIASIFVTKERFPDLYGVIMVAFAVTVLSIFIVGVSVRLYFFPRAEDNRRREFFGKAYNVSLIHEKTDGYYNNDQIEPVRRIAAQILENSWFSKSIALRILRLERAKVVIYFMAWFVCIYWRSADFGLILAVSQAVFSEQVIAKYIRLEWLRSRCEDTYDRTRNLFTSCASDTSFNAMAMDLCSFYETSKSNAAITFPSSTFMKMNHSLSEEWERIRLDLNI